MTVIRRNVYTVNKPKSVKKRTTPLSEAYATMEDLNQRIAAIEAAIETILAKLGEKSEDEDPDEEGVAPNGHQIRTMSSLMTNAEQNFYKPKPQIAPTMSVVESIQANYHKRGRV